MVGCGWMVKNEAVNGTQKENRYQEVLVKITAMLDTETDEIAKMASVSAVLAGEFDYFYWTGFYRLVGGELSGELVVGPYQGTPACLRIALDRGVCGAAVKQGVSLVVDDVHDFPGHIACDARSRSEVVVPVRNTSGVIIGVLDVDSEQIGAFCEIDRQGLERIVTEVFAKG